MGRLQRFLVFLVRVVALVGTVSATVVMINSHDSALVLNMKFDAKYTNSPTFKYFVGVNAIASLYTLIALFLDFKTLFCRLVFVSDLAVALLLDSSVSAALAIGDVGKKGNSHAGWLPICGQVPRFCDHVKWALISSFVAAILYVLLLLHSFRTLFGLLALKS